MINNVLHRTKKYEGSWANTGGRREMGLLFFDAVVRRQGLELLSGGSICIHSSFQWIILIMEIMSTINESLQLNVRNADIFLII